MAGNGKAITADNRGPLVNIVSWVFMTIMVMVSITKVANKWYRTRALMMDDYLLVVAMFLSIAQTVTVAQQVAHGLGKKDALDDPLNRPQYEQTSYASQLLYIVTLCFVKATTAFFIKSFAPVQWVHVATLCLAYGHMVWTIISLLVIAFQCRLPQPWAFVNKDCIGVVSFWDVFGVIDILTDLFLVLVPTAIVYKLQANKSHRVSILVPFLLRVLTVPVIILRLIFIDETYNSKRKFNDEVKVALATEIHLHSAIILACVPFIQAVIEGLQGGAMTSDLLYRQLGAGAGTGNQGANSYHLSELSRSCQKDSNQHQDPRSNSTDRLPENDANRIDPSQNSPTRYTPSPPDENDQRNNNFALGNDIAVHTTITTTMEHV